MKAQHFFVRTLVVLLSILFFTIYFRELWWVGVLVGLGFGAVLIGIDLLFKRFSLRLFNLGVVGLFFGYLLGLALQLVFRAIIDITALPFPEPTVEIVQIAIYLFALYLGVMMTLRAADELYVSIPFVKFERKGGVESRNLLLDASALEDPRLVGVANSGLLDGRLVLPRFVERELGENALEQLKKLRELPSLGLRTHETDFPEVPDVAAKLLRLARLAGGDVLTAEAGAVGTTFEDVRLINLHTLSKALKPIEQTDELITLRIQRYGKEEHQGVGYLEDGTMVVVNGGGDYIGQEIECRILSVKHTAAGRLIFCNVADSV